MLVDAAELIWNCAFRAFKIFIRHVLHNYGFQKQTSELAGSFGHHECFRSVSQY
jgi:hypothetical protein